MQNTFKLLFLLLIISLISGCTPKLTVKSLHPSKIHNEKISSIYVESFENDSIRQKDKIEEKLSNLIINEKKVFILNNNYQNVDAMIKGKVLESSLNYNIYYKPTINSHRCRIYSYDENKKIKECIEYYNRYIPCENRYYKVKTFVSLTNLRNNTVMFSKTYEKTKNIDKCYESYNYTFNQFSRDKKEINSKLADEIVNDLISDISPHYKYYDLEIVDTLNEEKLKFNTKQEDKFNESVQLIENKNLQLAQEELEKLDYEFKGKSWEVLYNLALTYEGMSKLYEANKYYKDAKVQAKEISDLELLQNAILRTQKNIKEKIKAKSQLP